MNCSPAISTFDCGIFYDPPPSPNRYDVESSETAFCCGGLPMPCGTSGCTECGVHYLPLDLATSGSSGRPWCVPAHARCTETKERATCEVCRRRLGLKPLPTCPDTPPFNGCEMRFDELFLRLCETIRIADATAASTEATSSLVVADNDCEVRAHQNGVIEVYRAGQLIATGRWGKRGVRRVDGIVSGIQPCLPSLIKELNALIDLEGDGPIENDWDVCPRCGSATIDAYGVAGGRPGLYRVCSKNECTFFEEPGSTLPTSNVTPNC